MVELWYNIFLSVVPTLSECCNLHSVTMLWQHCTITLFFNLDPTLWQCCIWPDHLHCCGKVTTTWHHSATDLEHTSDIASATSSIEWDIKLYPTKPISEILMTMPSTIGFWHSRIYLQAKNTSCQKPRFVSAEGVFVHRFDWFCKWSRTLWRMLAIWTRESTSNFDEYYTTILEQEIHFLKII